MADFELIDPGIEASARLVESRNVRRAISAGVIPQKLFVMGQFNSGKTPTLAKTPINSIGEAKNLFGAGSMLALLIESAFKNKGAIELTAFPLEDDGDAEAAECTITVTGTATSNGVYTFRSGNRIFRVVVLEDDTPTVIAQKIRDAINANLNLPFTATSALGVVTCTINWAGASGNDIEISLNERVGEDSELAGAVSIAITAFSGGLLNPDIALALSGMGNTHYTTLVCPYEDTQAYEALRTKWIELNNPTKDRIFECFIGSRKIKTDFKTLVSSKNAIGVSYVPVSLSNSHAFEIGGAVGGIVARNAQIDPARPYDSLELVGIAQAKEVWEYEDRDEIVKAGGSTTLTNDFGIVTIGDLVTTYKENPDLSENKAWRFVEAVYNSQTKRYTIKQLLQGAPFTRSIIVDNNSTTTKEYAVRPNTVKAFLGALVRSWVSEAWSKQEKDILDGITAEISTSNPGRINGFIPDIFSAGGKVYAVLHEWAFESETPL